MKGIKVGKYEYFKSTRNDKKLMTLVDDKLVHFGNPNYEHFKDKTGIWKNKNHLDDKRRKNYLIRSGNIKDKDGNLTKDNPKSPNYHSRRILW